MCDKMSSFRSGSCFYVLRSSWCCLTPSTADFLQLQLLLSFPSLWENIIHRLYLIWKPSNLSVIHLVTELLDWFGTLWRSDGFSFESFTDWLTNWSVNRSDWSPVGVCWCASPGQVAWGQSWPKDGPAGAPEKQRVCVIWKVTSN